jgi:wobble nucleotide-excising tRNase
MKKLLSIICLLLIVTSCKTKSNCDAYSQFLKKQTDSLESQIKNKKDSINLLNNYIVFLENETQFLGSVLAEKELEDGIE